MIAGCAGPGGEASTHEADAGAPAPDLADSALVTIHGSAPTPNDQASPEPETGRDGPVRQDGAPDSPGRSDGGPPTLSGCVDWPATKYLQSPVTRAANGGLGNAPQNGSYYGNGFHQGCNARSEERR